MKLYNHQQKLVDELPRNHLLAWEVGTGKTIAAIASADRANMLTLVVCPKSLKDQWIEEVNKHSKIPDKYKVLTKEEFKKRHKELERRDFIIIDEGHYFSGMKSQMHKSMLWYINYYHPVHTYILTGTPYMSTPWNIYALAHILGYKWNYMKFKREFFYDIKIGGRTIPKIKPKIEGKIAKLVDYLGSTVRMDECVDVPKQTFITETFDLTKEQMSAIAKVQMEETVHIVRWTKIHQICGGSLKGDGYTEDQFFKNEKVERLKDIVLQNKKIAVVCRYNNEINYLENALKKKGRYIYIINGKTKDKHSITKKIDVLDSAIVIIQASSSEGYDLATIPVMVFYSYDFALKNYIQMHGRVQRIRNIKKNTYISLITKGTIDVDVHKTLLNKEDFDLAIYKKQNARKRFSN